MSEDKQISVMTAFTKIDLHLEDRRDKATIETVSKAVAELVAYSRDQLKNRSNSIKSEHDKIMSKYTGDIAKVFEVVWFKVMKVYGAYKDEDTRNWKLAKEMHEANEKELGTHSVSVVYNSYLLSLHRLMYPHYKARLRWILSKDNREYNNELATKLKQIYMKKMSIESGNEINNSSDMEALRIVRGNSNNGIENLVDAKEFYLEVIEPICDLLVETDFWFESINHKKSKYYVEPTTDTESPNITSLENLFAQAIATKETVTKDAIDTNRKGIYEAMQKRGKFDGSLEDFKKEYPNPSERRATIINELLKHLESLVKPFPDAINKKKIKQFENFLKNKKKRIFNYNTY